MAMIPMELIIGFTDTDLQENLGAETNVDENVEGIALILEKGLPQAKAELTDWTIECKNGKQFLFFRNRQYVPWNDDLRQQICRNYHDTISAGHPGQQETLNAISQIYWWPQMRQFINNYVSGCLKCQLFKINRSPSKPALMPIAGSTSFRPFADCSMDLITDLLELRTADRTICNYILSMVDHGLMKGVILVPTTKISDHTMIRRLLHDNLFKRFGLLESIISDRDPQFTAQAFRELQKLIGVHQKFSTAFHPQTDGTTECFNQEIEAFLSIYCANNPAMWASKLAMAEFVHNNRRHTDRTKTPFELIMGMSPLAYPRTFYNTKFPSVEERLLTLESDRKEAQATQELAMQCMAQRMNSTFTPFQEGQRVLLSMKHLAVRYPSRKFSPKCEGPYKILEVRQPNVYHLEIPKLWRNVHDVFHATLLTPYHETQEYGPNITRPPPDIVEGEPEYEVEAILKQCTLGRKHQYLTKWKGYTDADNTWEPATSFTNVQGVLDTFLAQHPISTPR